MTTEVAADSTDVRSDMETSDTSSSPAGTTAVVTDSTADIPQELVDQYGLAIVSAYVSFGDEQLRDGVDISPAGFYHRLELQQDPHPKTSQPSPGDFHAVFERLLQTHDRIISVHISSKISGTYASARQGRNLADPKGNRITSIDSDTASLTTGFMALAAARTLAEGGTFDEAVDAAQSRLGRGLFAGTPETLEYLHRGGRMSDTQKMFGSMLGIRPVVGIVDGTIVGIAKVRSHRRAVRKLAQLVEEKAPVEDLGVMYTSGTEEAEELLEQLREFVKPGGHAVLGRTGAALGAHLGPGAVSVCVNW